MLKKVCFIAGVLMAFSVMADTTPQGSCANGGGTIYLGKDNARYCLSATDMNWWSAFAWCDAAHGRLISVQDCYGADGSITGTHQCPNFEEYDMRYRLAWTSTPAPTTGNSYIIYFYGSHGVSGDYGRKQRCMAVCKM